MRTRARARGRHEDLLSDKPPEEDGSLCSVLRLAEIPCDSPTTVRHNSDTWQEGRQTSLTYPVKRTGLLYTGSSQLAPLRMWLTVCAGNVTY